MEQGHDGIEFWAKPEIANVTMLEIQSLAKARWQLFAISMSVRYHPGAAIDADDAVAFLGEFDRVPASAAPEIQNGLGSGQVPLN
jgi:hypothetical protein